MSIYLLSMINTARPKAETTSVCQDMATLNVFAFRLDWHQPGLRPDGLMDEE